jgi:hypothetical protein
VKRADNPYATHIPVLIGIGKLFKIRRILELGSGLYSTSTFLNKSVFPDLISLRSFENDPAWPHKIPDPIKNDPRMTLTLVDGSISSAIKNVDSGKYDLVFVDDSANEAERTATIAQITQSFFDSTIVLIHDYEVDSYRNASKAFSNRFVFEAFNPNTGLLWNNARVDKHSLHGMERLLKKKARKIGPEDIDSWLGILNGIHAHF